MTDPIRKPHRSMTISVTMADALAREDAEFWRTRTPEERLDKIERLRREAGKFLHEYPIQPRRVLEITRS